MSAVFAFAVIDIFLPYADNLKVKRQIVNSIVDKLRARTVCSVCQTNNYDLWQKTQLGLAIVGKDNVFVEKELAKTRFILDSYDQIQVLRFETQYV